MPIARMTKVSVLAPRDMREELVDRLHHLGAVHIIDIASVAGEDDELKSLHDPFEPETRALRLTMAKTDFIIEMFQRFEKTKQGMISGFLTPKVHVTYEEFMEIEREIDLEDVYNELEDLDVGFRHAESAISELEDEIKAMKPWRGLDSPLGDMRAPASIDYRLVIVDPGDLAAWVAELEERCPHAAWEEVHHEKDGVFLAAVVHVESLAEFDALASEHGLEQAQFTGKEGTVAEEITFSKERLAAEAELKEGIERKIRERLPIKPQVMTLNDFLYNRLAKEEVKGRFLHTRSAVALEGWVEESRAEEVREEIDRLGPAVDMAFEAPRGDDIPPTLMVNRRHIRPAENLINLFGIPGHDETDPTPFVAPFFILFFAMCIGDLGYGIILALAFWLAMKKLDVSKATKSFLHLFFYCGIATIVVGVFTRGYFGIDGEVLPGFLKFPGTIDIIKDPKPLMLVCVALGLIHISVGVAIEMYDNMRNNSWWLGFCEQGTTLLLWFGIAVFGVGLVAGVGVIKTAGLYIMLAGAVSIVFLSNISSKSIAGKFFGGLFNMYGLFGGTIGDVASYLRLYALGLATVAIGFVVNLMAGMVLGVPVLGILLMLLLLLGGHLFNLLVNFLGAFVHPLRLQYVEFFGKFYEDGGELFAPITLETRKTMIDKE
jgi:V/A-type H+-transporting ATPase subunit I